MILSKAPLRITFAGGGSDVAARLHGIKGKVLSMTIDVHVFMSVHKRHDRKIVAAYSSVECTEDASTLKNGLIRSALNRHHIRNGIEIHSMGKLPFDACGMGGSGAAAVALLKSLERLTGEYRCPEELAEEASAIEIKDMNRTVGKQDHYAAAYGGVNEFSFDGENVTQTCVASHSPEFLKDLMVLVPCLNGQRDASSQLIRQFKKLSGTETVMSEMVPEAVQAFKKCDVEKLIRLLRTNWELKKSLPGVTTPSAEAIVSRAEELDGGAKLNGAGGGGMVFSLFPSKERALSFAKEFEGSFLVNADSRPALVVLDDGERW